MCQGTDPRVKGGGRPSESVPNTKRGDQATKHQLSIDPNGNIEIFTFPGGPILAERDPGGQNSDQE